MESCETLEDEILPTASSSSELYEDESPEASASESPEEVHILNFNNPSSWPPLSDDIRQMLVAHGPDQGINIDFKQSSTSASGRKFARDWFLSRTKNGEKIKRHRWLMHCKNKNALFCFPCLLSDNAARSTHLLNVNEGYYDWKHLNPTLPDHENFIAYRSNYVEWKLLEKNIKDNTRVYEYVSDQFQVEKRKWRDYLEIVVDAFFLC